MTLTTRTRIDGRTSRVAVLRGGAPLAYGAALDGWRDDETFRAFFMEELAAAPFSAYFWETPPVTRATLKRPFEFVLVNAPALAHAAPEPQAFRYHYAAARAGCATFENLGRDALLVAPTPADHPGADFAHLAAFTRTARSELQHAFWQAVGEAAEERLADESLLWISTSGLGVAWLHVRLDSRPKYYTHAPYREA